MPYFLYSTGNPYMLWSYNVLFTMFLVVAAEPAALASAMLFNRIRK
jgi:hypothetical protein